VQRKYGLDRMVAVIAMTVVAFHGREPTAFGELLGAARQALGAALDLPRYVDQMS
jgi:hypothetical protein